jgi:phage baseplate assembly protein gpV
MLPVTDLASLFFAQIRGAEDEADRIFEPVIGIVTDNKDPDKLGRIKVKLPTLTSDETTWWAPIVAMGAGAQRGWFFLPEVDDEVLVMFEHGDIARPVIIGQLWGGKDKPPLDTKDGKNTKRALHSRGGTKLSFDDDQGKITIEDGGGAGVVTLDAKSNKITFEAKQGDVAIHCKDDLTIVANEVEMKASASFTMKGVNVKGGSDAGVNLKGTGMLKINGAQVGINNGGAQAPQAPTANPAEVPDGGGGGGAGASSSPAQARSSGSGGGGAAASAPAAAPGSAAASPVAQPEPQPMLVAARWAKAKVAPGTAVTLTATCADMSGTSATFTIKDADDPDKTIATTSGACGDAFVEASWTTPASGPPSRFVFTVEASGKSADSGVLTLVKPVKATLMLDEEPAAKIRVKLVVAPGGDELRATADDQGQVEFLEAPLGDYTLMLEDA